MSNAGRWCSWSSSRLRQGLSPVGAAFVLCVSTGCAVDPQASSLRVTASDLGAGAATYNGKVVTVTGRVMSARLHGGSRSPLRRVLDIEDGGQTITAVSTGGPACRGGDTATVEGRFKSRDGVIEASWVTCS